MGDLPYFVGSNMKVWIRAESLRKAGFCCRLCCQTWAHFFVIFVLYSAFSG